MFQLPFADRQPAPGEEGEACVIDLETGKTRSVARTRGWEPQLGANLNWGGSDHELYFNDVDPETWTPFAWKLDPLTGTRQRMEGTVYHASHDGRLLVSANMTTMRKTQHGYGVLVPDEYVLRNVGAAEDDGFTITETDTGKCRPLCSIREILTDADPPVRIGDAADYEIYGFHSKFSPQDDRVMLSIRWFPAHDEPRWDLFTEAYHEVRYAWVTMRMDGSSMHCVVGPEQWEKGGNHATWFPDGRRISMNLNIDRDVMRLVQVNADGSGFRKMRDDVVGSGHPTLHPDGRYILTDAYQLEDIAYGDGTVPLRWIDLAGGTETNIVRINTNTPSEDIVLRVDPHPAWDRTWRYVTFNGFVEGTRRVFIADMDGLIGPD